ncbi:serine hydrolase domain-containing protein [Sandaracinobacteroides hominis]|uniref:serine hydrolase domain-containing protein n=1 Tax=Sandaracinobacteroides hominis TaxID=2780086 RepID=UPI001F2A3F61|nr:serine hydrolase domain-containing protein [Sandaracinobacteroides hominis]
MPRWPDLFRAALVAGLLGLAAHGQAVARAPAQAVEAAWLQPAFDEAGKWVGDAFPGAVLAVGQDGRALVVRAFGRLSSAPDAAPMPVDALFDLASLTKVVATTTAAALLVDRGQLELDAPVSRYLPEFGGAAGHDAITVRDLLAHSSGLAPEGEHWRTAKNAADILAAIDRMPVEAPPGTKSVYRDENLMLVAEIVSRVSGQPFERFVQANIFRPLGMKDTGFNPGRAELPRIPPTEIDNRLRNRLVQGEVHDENAWVMGGIAGHAGLFSTAADLSRLAQLWLGEGRFRGRRLMQAGTVAQFRARQNRPEGSTRALGWDTPTLPGGFAGDLASPRAILHTGFTGTSIYIDPDRRAYVILLSNRVNPTRENNRIRAARPAIHNAVLQALDAR